LGLVLLSQKHLSYRPEIDGLRAIAVCSVILNHLHSPLLPSGFLGVDVFFVISGYVITRSLLERNRCDLGDVLAEFYSRRVKRIIPALIVCVVATAFLGAFVVNPRATEYAKSMRAGFFALFGTSNIYFAKEATDYFGASAPLNLFTQTWSLGVEEQFYLVFPLLLWLLCRGEERRDGQRRLLLTMIPLGAASLCAFIWLDMKAPSDAYYTMPPRFWELSLGCIIALLPNTTPKAANAAWGWIGAVVLITAMAAPQELQLYTTAAAAIASGLLIMTIPASRMLYALLASSGMAGIGLISYSLYLWHWSVFALSRWTVGIDAWTAPALLLVTFGIAALSYAYVERPLRRASWSRFRLATIGYGLAAGCCAAAAVLALKFAGGALYAGVPAQMAAKGVETLLDGKRLDGALQWHARDCVLSSDSDVGKQIDLDRCAIGDRPSGTSPRFLVVGNSFSAAELEMYAVLSDTGVGSVSVTSSWGASPTPSIPNDSAWSKANSYYWKEVVPSMISHLNAGDVLVMVSDLADLSPAEPTAESEADLSLLKADLMALASKLGQRGIKIIFQAGTPFLREAQCPPDAAVSQWFNFGRSLPCVYLSKQDTITRLAPLNAVLSDVKRENDNFIVYDFLPVLCPGDVCRYQNEQGTFLYRDIFSHPSLEASALGRQDFLMTARRAMQIRVSEP
jgi:peptidoglycan/LPS O-acetylase OafA/YrhL